jgi:hypothetical protein
VEAYHALACQPVNDIIQVRWIASNTIGNFARVPGSRIANRIGGLRRLRAYLESKIQREPSVMPLSSSRKPSRA